MPNDQIKKRWLPTALVLGYVVAVLTIDTLAVAGVKFGIDWALFRWRTSNGFDAFKFVSWFVVPFLCSLPWMDWAYFGFKRWRRRDLHFLLALAALGVGAVLLIQIVPSLRDVYRGLGDRPWAVRWRYSRQMLVWTFSWLVGWEFLHRYFLLTQVRERWPRFGWLLVPLSEGVYHLQKPFVETIGMVAFSLVVTRWASNRQNVLLPFLAHLTVELALLAYIVLC